MSFPTKNSYFFLLFVLGTSLQAQEAFQVPTTNSHAVVQQRLAATDITVDYNRPSEKGRKIFGALVPYGQVWRTGSDASTKVTFSTAVFIDGSKLEAGKYELFSIPGQKEWTLIFQQNQSQWGSYRYDPNKDALRVKARTIRLAQSVENFSIEFASVGSATLQMQLSWENTLVSIPISVDLKTTVIPQLEASLKQEGRKPYFRAAMFYFENDLGIDRAAELMALALESNPGHIGMLYRYALILEKKGDMEGALEAANQSLEGAEKVGEELKAEYIKLNTALLNRLKK